MHGSIVKTFWISNGSALYGPIKILNIFCFGKYQKDVENFVESHWKRDLYCNPFGLFNILQLFSYNLWCWRPLFRIAWRVPCWQFVKFILCILTNNCVSFEVSSKALFLQTTFQLSRLISVIILKTLWCANAILLCEWFYSRRLFLFWFITESISFAYLNKKIDSNQGR